MAPGPEQRIGNYRVVAELGPSGSGLLLRGEHLVLPRHAILKIVHPAFAALQPYVLQTLREACILEAIAHPGVPVVYESGVLRQAEHRPWFAFEVIQGPTLEELLAAGPLSVPEVAGLIRDLADILDHAHRRGVIHRGLGPDRIVITSERRYPLCIPDWSEAIAHDTTGHLPAGTPDGDRSYAAPELVADGAGPGDVDDRVDMFALGAIAHRALTGARPVAAGAARPVAPAGAPGELIAIIDSLLAFDRFDRPSASEVRADVDWLFSTLPALRPAISGVQRHASTQPPDACGTVSRTPANDAYLLREQRRLRRPRWTPDVRYLETPQIERTTVEDDRAKD